MILKKTSFKKGSIAQDVFHDQQLVVIAYTI